jgi:hypothetical protein
VDKQASGHSWFDLLKGSEQQVWVLFQSLFSLSCLQLLL